MIDGLVPREILRPASVDEVRAMVCATGTREGAALIATGLGAHLDVGAPPRGVDALLDLRALDRIVDHQAADMTVTVEAGCPLATLDAVLSSAGQWLALDPPAFERTTVGGLVAANLSGPLRASRGTVRDCLLGLRVVAADGALVACGGRVVKNVAGYDLPKLHVGALGTLGVIVEATFKVMPRPAREEAAVLSARDHAEAAATALAVRDRFDPCWLEAGTLEDGVGVAVGVAGIAAEVAAARRTIEALARERRVELRWVDDGPALRRSLAQFPIRPAAAVLRASVLPSDVGWTMAQLRELGAPVLAHAANGVVRARMDDPRAVAGAVVRLRPELASRDGFLVVERASPEVKAGVDVWGDAGEGVPLMRRLKDAFDPRGLFAPGRHVGGI